MPPHLHPRSSATTTLFASTLAASFIIVGIPHIFPCPAPRKGYLDEDGKVVRKRRRRREADGAIGLANTGAYDTATSTRPENPQMALDGELKSLLGTVQLSGNSSSVGRQSIKGGANGGEEEEEEDDDDDDEMRALFREMKKEEAAMELRRRECPVPKPRGMIGELLGFGRDGRRQRVGHEDSGPRVR